MKNKAILFLLVLSSCSLVNNDKSDSGIDSELSNFCVISPQNDTFKYYDTVEIKIFYKNIKYNPNIYFYSNGDKLFLYYEENDSYAIYRGLASVKGKNSLECVTEFTDLSGKKHKYGLTLKYYVLP